MKPTKKTKAYKATMKKIKKLPIKVMKAKDVPEGADVIDEEGDFLALHSDGKLTLWSLKSQWSDIKGFHSLQDLFGAKRIKIKRKKKAKPVITPDLTPDLTPAELPSFPFKLTCGDRPEVRAWLESKGCNWVSGRYLTGWKTEEKTIYVSGSSVYLSVVEVGNYPEINLAFLGGVVVDWSCSPSNKTRLQEALDSLTSANNQAQEAANTVQQIIDTMEE